MADHAASALGGCLRLLASALQHGWGRESAGSATFVTGTPIPFLNGVRVVRTDCEASEVLAGLADVAREGAPFSLEVRPGWREQGKQVAAAVGMTAAGEVPLMVATGPVKASPIDGLSLRALAPSESSLHGHVAAAAFEAPPAIWSQLVNETTFAQSGVRGYIGEADGEYVTTALSVRIGDAVGIYNVGTLETHRGRGYGGAISALAASEAFERGASLVWLQSSEMGYGVYERLGFRTLEHWPVWLSEPIP